MPNAAFGQGGIFGNGYFNHQIPGMERSHPTEDDVLKKYKVGNIAYLASEQADHIIENLKKLPDSESEAAGDQIANGAARYLS
jgi:hypothetical protein